MTLLIRFADINIGTTTRKNSNIRIMNDLTGALADGLISWPLTLLVWWLPKCVRKTTTSPCITYAHKLARLLNLLKRKLSFEVFSFLGSVRFMCFVTQSNLNTYSNRNIFM